MEAETIYFFTPIFTGNEEAKELLNVLNIHVLPTISMYAQFYKHASQTAPITRYEKATLTSDYQTKSSRMSADET